MFEDTLNPGNYRMERYAYSDGDFSFVGSVETIDGEYAGVSFRQLFHDGEQMPGLLSDPAYGFDYDGEKPEGLDAFLDGLAEDLKERYGAPFTGERPAPQEEAIDVEPMEEGEE